MAKLLKTALFPVVCAATGVRLNNVSFNSAVCTAAQVSVLAAHIRLATPLYDTALIFVTAYCLPENKIAVVYGFLSRFAGRFTLVSICSSNDSVDSIQPLFYNAWWYEREVHEMFGLQFKNATDSRNLLLQYGAVDFPLKKTVKASMGTGFISKAAIADLTKNVA